MYETYYGNHGRRSHPVRNTIFGIIGLLVICIVLAVVQLLRPLPVPQLSTANLASQAVNGNVAIHWPTNGEAAVAVSGLGEVGQSGAQTPVPIASLTKLMTALFVRAEISAGKRAELDLV